MSVEGLRQYLRRLERQRKRDEPNNKKTYEQARTLSAWLSVADFGNEQAQKRAIKIISQF